VTDPPRPRLAADSIVHRFGTRTVLHAAYVDAVAGTVTALVGQSGSGKTTLLEILVGRRRPLDGQVRHAGARVPHRSRAALARRGVVYVPDAPWLSSRVRLRRQLALVARVWGADADAIVRDSGLASLVDRAPPALSTGERRLCELAVASACRPDAIVLDEPFRDLDPLHREAIGRRLRALAADGVAVLFADHDATMVAEIADRLFAIEEGRTRVVPDFRNTPIAEWYRGWSGPPPA
jgi:ABC-type multidrug transport system ATPase subunit